MIPKSSMLLTIGAGLVIYYFVAKGNAAKNLKVNFQKLNFVKGSGASFPSMLVNFKIINGSSTPIRIDSIVGDLFINDKFFSTVSQVNPITILGANETIYPVKIETGLLSALMAAYNLFRDKKRLVVKFVGKVNSGGVMIPINNTIIQM